MKASIFELIRSAQVSITSQTHPNIAQIVEERADKLHVAWNEIEELSQDYMKRLIKEARAMVSQQLEQLSLDDLFMSFIIRRVSRMKGYACCLGTEEGWYLLCWTALMLGWCLTRRFLNIYACLKISHLHTLILVCRVVEGL